MNSNVSFWSGIALIVGFAAWNGRIIGQTVSPTRKVIINRVALTDQEITYLEKRFQTTAVEGAYWYDKVSGAWGAEGGPTLGIGVAGLQLGGPLRADASRGTTKVFINGRELHWLDVLGLQQLGPVYPGRYWVDARGNCGYEGGPPLFNLVQIANARRAASGQSGSILSNNSWYTPSGGQFKDPLGNSHIFGH